MTNHTHRLKRARSLAFLFTLLLLCAPALAEATTISAPIVNAEPGQTFVIDVSITDAIDLSFFQFDFLFDASILQANAAGAIAGAGLPADWLLIPGFVDNGGGQILGITAFGSPFSGDAVIAEIEFTAVGSGSSPIGFANSFVNFSDQGFETTPGQVPVPEPSTLVLLTVSVGVVATRLTRRRSLLQRARGSSGSRSIHNFVY